MTSGQTSLGDWEGVARGLERERPVACEMDVLLRKNGG